jgi:hypothetical protein
MTDPMERRRLLRLLVALGVSAVMHDKVASAAGSHCRTALFDELDVASIQALGREYLAGRPGSEAIEAVARILATPSIEDETLSKLRRMALGDLAAGRIVNLSGWFVSETEGCVFAALSRCA